MKTRNTLFLLSVAALAACGGGEPAEPPMSDEEALAARTAHYQEAFNAHDAAAVAALYVEEGVTLNSDHSVSEGRAAIETRLEAQFAASPTLSLEPAETMILGDMAVSHGSYTYESQGTSTRGHYMTASAKQESGEWMGMGSITNRYSPLPEGTAPQPLPDERPPEEGMMTELVEQFERHYNLGHADMVADLYAENAVAAFSDAPASVGRAAIAAELQRRMDQGPAALDIHDRGSVDLGDGWMLDGGDWEVTAEDGTVMREGFYMNLVHNGQIVWGVTN
jgi:uncharacterized protein (TIGR02246 family)